MSTHLTELRYRDGAPRDTQLVHRTLEHALNGTEGRILWCKPHRNLLIVQGEAPVRARDIGGVAESHSEQIRTRYDVGEPVTLSLIANPTHYTPVSGRGQRPKRRALPIDRHEEWLRGRLGAAVDLHEVVVEPLGARTGVRHDHKVVHVLSGFLATGTVHDTDALEHLIVEGVGPAKAYGAGLLLVSAA